ncbi:MAG TPA: hypothetical protein VNS56_11645 [Methylomirabilota bacterium]|nr:hypothetical protein [Methylomirabilota bacterium]
MQAAEALVLAGVVAALYWALTPLRRRLEAAIARLLTSGQRRRRGDVIVLPRRSDGTFDREEGR